MTTSHTNTAAVDFIDSIATLHAPAAAAMAMAEIKDREISTAKGLLREALKYVEAQCRFASLGCPEGWRDVASVRDRIRDYLSDEENV